MNKPQGYDQAQAGGSYTPIALGGHRAIIKQVLETTSRSGKDMIVVSIDFAAEDAQAKYFENQYRADTRADKKWPYQAVQYIMTNDAEGNTSRSFKGFCTAYEQSNGTQIQWGGQNWGKQFQGRRIGVVYGAVTEEYNGKVSTRHKIRWFCDDHKALDQDIPQPKDTTPVAGYGIPTQADSGAEFMPFRDGDDLPFK